MPEDGIGLDGDNGSADDNDNDDEHNAISYFKECIFTEEAKLTRAHKDLRVAHLKLSTSERQVHKLTAKLMLQERRFMLQERRFKYQAGQMKVLRNLLKCRRQRCVYHKGISAAATMPGATDAIPSLGKPGASSIKSENQKLIDG